MLGLYIQNIHTDIAHMYTFYYSYFISFLYLLFLIYMKIPFFYVNYICLYCCTAAVLYVYVITLFYFLYDQGQKNLKKNTPVLNCEGGRYSDRCPTHSPDG